MNNLANRIKELRKENKLTQEEMARELRNRYNLKTDRVMISKWETGFQTPEIYTISCIADLFKVTLDYLNGRNSNFTSSFPSSPFPQNITSDEQQLLNKYNQLNDLGKEKTNEYIDDLIASEKYTQEDKKEVIDFNDKVRTVDSDDELKAVAYGNGDISDDETPKHT